MESIKLPNGPTIDFYTVAEKKPSDWDSVIFITNYKPSPVCLTAKGHYRSFKKAPGRFVSTENGSHQEQFVLYWAESYSIKI